MNSGSIVQGYHILRALGSNEAGGSQSTLYSCEKDDDPYILKKYHGWETKGGITEITNLKKIAPHKNVVEIVTVLRKDGEFGIVMRREPKDLYHVLSRCNPKSVPQRKHFIRQLLQGLKHIHSYGVIHKDIKAENCLISVDDTLRICDFAMSCRVEERPNPQGTMSYMPPEYLRNQWLSTKFDVWSAGCVMYQLCYIVPPFETGLGRVSTLHAIRRGIKWGKDGEGNRFIAYLLQMDPKKRPSAKETLTHKYLTTK